jgi:hypothetical protein
MLVRERAESQANTDRRRLRKERVVQRFEHGAGLVIAFGPAISFGADNGFALFVYLGPPTAMNRVYLEIGDPLPLFQKGIPVSGGFFSGVSVKEEKRIQVLGLDPPYFRSFQTACD